MMVTAITETTPTIEELDSRLSELERRKAATQAAIESKEESLKRSHDQRDGLIRRAALGDDDGATLAEIRTEVAGIESEINDYRAIAASIETAISEAEEEQAEGRQRQRLEEADQLRQTASERLETAGRNGRQLSQLLEQIASQLDQAAALSTTIGPPARRPRRPGLDSPSVD